VITALEDVKLSVHSITEVSSSVASAVEEQSVTTNDIAHNMQRAAQGTSSISENIRSISSNTDSSKSASDEMLSAAEELSQQAEELDREMNQFLKEIREA
jgi:methyl-accepting chemotaxis protein